MQKKTISIFGIVLVGILLFGTGIWFGQARAFSYGMGQSNWMMRGVDDSLMSGRFGTVMNNDYGQMMPNNMSGQYMMDMRTGQGNMMMGNMGMMTGFSGLSSSPPLTLSEVDEAITNYLTTINIDNLILGEIMIFDNHAYAQVVDSETGRGVFELLVDPSTGEVFPEPGPNMMWNTQFGMMAGNNSSMMGGNMMGNYGYAPNASINISTSEAVVIAQAYLDAYLPGKTTDETADIFPGYYTLHILENEETVGMLSVNTYSGQTFYHNWHGELIDMSDEDHS